MKKDFSNYYIDLERISNLKETEGQTIIRMYQDMLHFMAEGGGREMVAMSFFNTLEMGGYIKNRQTEERENKLGDLING
jgi:hypothetical protein